MHNLSGVFIQEGEYSNIDGIDLYSFSVIYPNKVRVYYVEEKDEYMVWMSNLRKVTGYSCLTDIYEVKVYFNRNK